MPGNTRLRSKTGFTVLLASQLFSAMPPLEAVSALVSVMMSVELVEQRENIEVETPRHQQGTIPRNSPETHIRPSSSRRSSEVWRRTKVGRLTKSMYGNSRCFEHPAT